jgi:Mg2+ and Co2+ transporter CorA
VEKNTKLTKEIERLERQNSELSDDLKSKNDLLNHLKQENDVIKITKTISSDEDRMNTKIVIDELVREIDNSLNLLNK